MQDETWVMEDLHWCHTMGGREGKGQCFPIKLKLGQKSHKFFQKENMTSDTNQVTKKNEVTNNENL